MSAVKKHRRPSSRAAFVKVDDSENGSVYCVVHECVHCPIQVLYEGNTDVCEPEDWRPLYWRSRLEDSQ